MNVTVKGIFISINKLALANYNVSWEINIAKLGQNMGFIVPVLAMVISLETLYMVAESGGTVEPRYKHTLETENRMFISHVMLTPRGI